MQPDLSIIRSAAELTLLAAALVLLLGLLFAGIQKILLFLLSLVFGSRIACAAVNVLTFPGTVFHELSHALAAVLTGGKVTSIRLLPRGDTLGSVRMIPPKGAVRKGLCRTFSAIAPVLFGLAFLIFMNRTVYPKLSASGPAWKVLYWYLFVSVLLHMDLSPADCRAAAKGTPVCLLLLFVIFWILLLLDPGLAEEGASFALNQLPFFS